jgi:hypothetical protein
MTTRENGAGRELLESVSDNGTRWAFVILTDDGWAITRNGQRIAVGTADPKSIHAGVAQFATVTHPAAGESLCDPVVQNYLNRIETQIPLGTNSKLRRRRAK